MFRIGDFVAKVSVCPVGWILGDQTKMRKKQLVLWVSEGVKVEFDTEAVAEAVVWCE